jgi:drug/metabolite transporter (DMT)-like permease
MVHKFGIGVGLVCLNIVFNSGLLFTRLASYEDGSIHYSTPSVVMISEILQAFISLLLLGASNILTCFNTSTSALVREMESDTETASVLSPRSSTQIEKNSLVVQSVSFILPAFLFAVSNNLQYYVLLFLDPSSVQTLLNTRIIVTAIFINLLVKKKMSKMQYSVIISLACSIALTRLNQQETWSIPTLSVFWGLCLITIIVVTHSFASVYLEIKMKNNFSTSIHFQNVSLYGFGFIINFGFYIIKEIFVNRWNLFHDFNFYTVMSIFCMIMVGLTVSAILKYLDNIALIFSNSGSVIVVTILSALFLGGSLSINQLLTTLCILMSVFIYVLEDEKIKLADRYLSVQITKDSTKE